MTIAINKRVENTLKFTFQVFDCWLSSHVKNFSCNTIIKYHSLNSFFSITKFQQRPTELPENTVLMTTKKECVRSMEEETAGHTANVTWDWSGTNMVNLLNTLWDSTTVVVASGFHRHLNMVSFKVIYPDIPKLIIKSIYFRINLESLLQTIHRYRSSHESSWQPFSIDFLSEFTK